MAAPDVNINIFPSSHRNITIGQNITAQCAITTNYGHATDIDVTPHIFWDITYTNDGEVVRNSFEAQLTTLTPAVFFSSLQSTLILNSTNYTCRSYLEPSSLDHRILVRQSITNVATRIVIPEGLFQPEREYIPPSHSHTCTHMLCSFTIYFSSPSGRNN